MIEERKKGRVFTHGVTPTETDIKILRRGVEENEICILKAFFKIFGRTGANHVDIRWRDQTMLMTAAYEGQPDIAQYLIDRGADVEATDEYKDWSPMVAATKGGKKQMIDFLLEKGCAINNHPSPLSAAMWCSSPEFLDFLLTKNVPLENRHINGRTVFHQAVADYLDKNKYKHGYIKSLAAAGADINTQDDNGMTPLMTAAFMKSGVTFQQLLSMGARLDIADKQGRTVEDIVHLQNNQTDMDEGDNDNVADILHAFKVARNADIKKNLTEAFNVPRPKIILTRKPPKPGA